MAALMLPLSPAPRLCLPLQVIPAAFAGRARNRFSATAPPNHQFLSVAPVRNSSATDLLQNAGYPVSIPLSTMSAVWRLPGALFPFEPGPGLFGPNTAQPHFFPERQPKRRVPARALPAQDRLPPLASVPRLWPPLQAETGAAAAGSTATSRLRPSANRL